MKTISKMYFKYDDVLKSESKKQALEINSYIRCYVKMYSVNLFSRKFICRFVVDVINDKNETSDLKLFESIKDFNDFVKFERWLNE